MSLKYLCVYIYIIVVSVCINMYIFDNSGPAFDGYFLWLIMVFCVDPKFAVDSINLATYSVIFSASLVWD